MKLRYIAALAALGTMGACLTQKQPKVSYEFPEEMLPAVKESYIQMWEKGRILYDVNCSRCHNQKVKGKMIIPEFTEEMLAAYEVRLADPEHEMAVSDTRVNTEELNLITIFLTFRKHDSVALNKLMQQPRDHDHESVD